MHPTDAKSYLEATRASKWPKCATCAHWRMSADLAMASWSASFGTCARTKGMMTTDLSVCSAWEGRHDNEPRHVAEVVS